MKSKNMLGLLLSAALLGSAVFAAPVLAEENTEGKYRSELTNEWIDASLKAQRPIAAVVDNEITSLDHFGVNQGDVVYEIMNSVANGRITRLMVVMKDWAEIEQLGSIRSARPTNFMLAAEYNALLLHDGGPGYIEEWVARDYTNNLSGGFARFSNGKDMEFTEYVTAQDYHNPTTGNNYAGLLNRIAQSGYSTNYNEYYPGTHFEFAEGAVDLSSHANAADANHIALPFPHNSSELNYNAETGLYEYSVYGRPHIDVLDNQVTTFKNVIITSCDFTQYDNDGYMIYNLLTTGTHDGYYVVNGKAVPITWSKNGESDITVYTEASTGQTIQLDTGKTYIAIVPSDVWESLVIE